MSIRPIDLQNLFGRLAEVSKQQAATNEASLHAQQVAGAEIAEKATSKNSKVTETDTLQEGPEKSKSVSDDDKPRNQHEQKKKREETDEEEEDIFKDPDLGNRIDIST